MEASASEGEEARSSQAGVGGSEDAGARHGLRSASLGFPDDEDTAPEDTAGRDTDVAASGEESACWSRSPSRSVTDPRPVTNRLLQIGSALLPRGPGPARLAPLRERLLPQRPDAGDAVAAASAGASAQDLRPRRQRQRPRAAAAQGLAGQLPQGAATSSATSARPGRAGPLLLGAPAAPAPGAPSGVFPAGPRRAAIRPAAAPRGRQPARLAAPTARPTVAARSRPGSAPRRRAAQRRGLAEPSGGAAARAGSAGRARRISGNGWQQSQRRPSEENCYAYCLADRVDFRQFKAWNMDRMKKRAAEIASAAVAAARQLSPGSAAAPPGREDAYYQDLHELQVVALNKDVLLLKIGHKDCFVFAFGCLVCWGCNSTEARIAKDTLQPFLLKPLSKLDEDEDHIAIVTRSDLGDGLSAAAEVVVSSRQPPTFERLALAYALAQSVRLGSLETRVERSIAKTRHIPESLAKSGDVCLSQEQVTSMMGELFVLRNQANLETDILDTPEILWDYGDYEPLYDRCRENLEVDKRVDILNQRFEVLQDLFDVLEGELQETHAGRLEWVVIVLCAMEAIVMGFRLYSRCYGPRSAPLATDGSSSLLAELEGRSWLAVPLLGPLAWLGRRLLPLAPIRALSRVAAGGAGTALGGFLSSRPA